MVRERGESIEGREREGGAWRGGERESFFPHTFIAAHEREKESGGGGGGWERQTERGE